MRSQRVSGILLHPTSLPGRFGIGELGREARAFLDGLAEAGQGLWQVLPLGPTGYGDSPYQCFSAFAGNPLLVSLERLRDEGLLAAEDLAGAPAFPEEEVDFGAVIGFKGPLLRRAHSRFEAGATPSQRDAFAGFCASHSAWLDDFALFMALKEAHDGVAWSEWGRALSSRDSEALSRARAELAVEIRSAQFSQFLFFDQWQAVRTHAHRHGIRILGDVPIFVSFDSADVWAHPEMFHLDTEGRPTVVSGVPPDYFSATGQRWGNPLYRWDVLEASGFSWWVERLRATLRLVDLVRLDHFRGFEASWEIPATEETAIRGHWVKGPGARFFEAIRNALGGLPMVAENLGVITPEVEALRERFDLPGMAILQFAFGADPQADDFKPHSYPRNRAAYSGTHDNDTTVGWWTSAGAGDSTRSADQVQAERASTLRYLGTDGREVHWDFIRSLLASVADTVIFPMQDVLGLGSSARMNLPGRPSGNWRWRMLPGAMNEAIRRRLREMAESYGRVAPLSAGL
jgi:4-alpha-glucanotransferase